MGESRVDENQKKVTREAKRSRLFGRETTYTDYLRWDKKGYELAVWRCGMGSDLNILPVACQLRNHKPPISSYELQIVGFFLEPLSNPSFNHKLHASRSLTSHL